MINALCIESFFSFLVFNSWFNFRMYVSVCDCERQSQFIVFVIK